MRGRVPPCAERPSSEAGEGRSAHGAGWRIRKRTCAVGSGRGTCAGGDLRGETRSSILYLRFRLGAAWSSP